MRINMINGNIFNAKDTYIAHCISADFALGAGIAEDIELRYSVRKQLFTLYPNYISYWDNSAVKAGCIFAGKIINLVTKRNYYNKPTYESIEQSLILCRDMMIQNNINKVSMPKIGCGLDGKSWSKVYSIIERVFASTDINIDIYYL